MTGPDHYRNAERTAADADVAVGQYEEEGYEHKRDVAALLLAEAQVHATLALTAATMARNMALTPADRREWQKAIDPEYAAECAAEVSR